MKKETCSTNDLVIFFSPSFHSSTLIDCPTLHHCTDMYSLTHLPRVARVRAVFPASPARTPPPLLLLLLLLLSSFLPSSLRLAPLPYLLTYRAIGEVSMSRVSYGGTGVTNARRDPRDRDRGAFKHTGPRGPSLSPFVGVSYTAVLSRTV